MPEGDNIHAHARQLQVLIDQPLKSAWSKAVDRRALMGQHVVRVEALGKHLVISFSEGSAVRVHLGMTGRWRRVAADVSRETLAQATLALVTRESAWLCQRARTIEWARARLIRGSDALSRLGPDLLGDVDLEVVLQRAREPRHAARPIAEVLLDQSICSGIGNVYKCELLFMHHIDPWARLDAIDDVTLRAIYADAARLLRANVGQPRTTTADPRPGPRASRGHARLWVYGRARRACLRCGHVIVQKMQLPSLRPTYFCPTCQRSSGAA
jgi:endonuclease-8